MLPNVIKASNSWGSFEKVSEAKTDMMFFTKKEGKHERVTSGIFGTKKKKQEA
jgi:hypothetical protein